MNTLCDLLIDSVARNPRPDLLVGKVGDAWKPISSDEVLATVRTVARALCASGVQAGERVGILSSNRPEWTLSDFGMFFAAAVTVPVYPTLTSDQITYILNDADVRLCFAQNRKQLDKLLDAGKKLKSLERIVVFDDTDLPGDPRVTSWSQFLEEAEKTPDTEIDQRIAALSPDDLATLIYTSGTTGDPKGVILTHRNFCSNVSATCEVLPIQKDDVALSFLPLSHVFERMADLALVHVGACLTFAESFDQLAHNISEIRPTFLAAVPRVYEKFQEAILHKIQKASPFQQRMFHRALKAGMAKAAAIREHRPIGFFLGMRAGLMDSLVSSKIRGALGGRLRLLIAGGAPLDPDLGKWFDGLGLTILEGYGLTETSPVITINRPNDRKFGTVGKPIQGVQVRIASDGEILAKGPNIMKGYYNRKKETKEVFTDDWFHTGDIGEFDSQGFLTITDRKKNLLKTSGGKYVAPQPIEDKLRQHALIANAVVVGNARKYCVALVEPDFQTIRSRAATFGLVEDPDPAELGKCEPLTGAIHEVLDEVNADLPSYETIKYFRLLPAPLTIDSGELTPTLKVTRQVVEENYKHLIDEMYSNS